MTAKKAAKKKAKKRKPVLGTVDRILNSAKLPDPRREGRRFFCVEPVYAIQMDKAFWFVNDEGRVRGRKGDFLLCRGDRLWKEPKRGFMSRHTMVDDRPSPFDALNNPPIMDCDDMLRWYRPEEGRWVKDDGPSLSLIDWLLMLSGLAALIFAGTALLRTLPNAILWWVRYW